MLDRIRSCASIPDSRQTAACRLEVDVAQSQDAAHVISCTIDITVRVPLHATLARMWADSRFQPTVRVIPWQASKQLTESFRQCAREASIDIVKLDGESPLEDQANLHAIIHKAVGNDGEIPV